MCVAAPGADAVTYTQPFELSNPVFPAVKVYSVFLLTGYVKKDSANLTGSDLLEIASQNLQQVEMLIDDDDDDELEFNDASTLLGH